MGMLLCERLNRGGNERREGREKPSSSETAFPGPSYKGGLSTSQALSSGSSSWGVPGRAHHPRACEAQLSLEASVLSQELSAMGSRKLGLGPKRDCW